jgi:hypothetical protein
MSRSIVVLESTREREPSAVARAIATALATSDEPESKGGGVPLGEDAVIHNAHAAVCLDADSLDRAREAGVPFCVAVLPGFGISWDGPLEEADRVFVAHESIARELATRGVPEKRIEVVGPIVPGAVTADRAAARTAAKLEGDDKLVLVPAPVLEEEGIEAVLLQLGLVSGAVAFLFDVERDAALASALREKAPVHGIEAWMFADDPERYWGAADLVLALATGEDVSRALALGTPLAIMPSIARSGETARKALASANVATPVDSLATLSVAIERALDPAVLEERRSAIAGLDVSASPERLADALERARAEHAATQHAPRGLPHGLEHISSRDASPRSAAKAEPKGARGEPGEKAAEAKKTEDDLEARVERDLQELKKRLK